MSLMPYASSPWEPQHNPGGTDDPNPSRMKGHPTREKQKTAELLTKDPENAEWVVEKGCFTYQQQSHVHMHMLSPCSHV